ncbi:hypothetical protein GLOIN_2v1789989 [Rhizophagus irregularis DAOM 181602=DAOM 197198]|nr:hypothetical protein GLOIN_2v1789989 [Rhizophagus irregularis DAOM 181602=DAOM 197198]
MAALNLNANLPVYIQWPDDAALTLIQRQILKDIPLVPRLCMTRDSTRNSLTSFGEWSSGPPGEIGWIVGHTSIESAGALAPDPPTTTESAGALVLDLPTTESAGALTDYLINLVLIEFITDTVVVVPLVIMF